ncbi:MAG: PDZ domain-containing protein [Gammaproteobacteria bacterium]|nr:PDZ domain-containing protein [Gammaproteobacteria bacterium]
MSNTHRLLLLSVPVLILLGACNTVSHHERAARDSQEKDHPGKVEVVDLRAKTSLEQILPELSNSRIVYVGETHDQYGHHLNQLAIIQGLHALNPDMAIGLEFFQQPFQPILDDFIRGDLDEKQMLLESEWYERWRYDYRLYRPILAFAKDNGIPLIALNLSREITDRVSEVGIEGLNAGETSRIPAEIDRSDTLYRERLRAIFSLHPHSGDRDFERFIDVQLLWDEGMADRTARYLDTHPDCQIVVLAGSGHLMYGSGIPQRVYRRKPVTYSTLLPGNNLKIEPGIADFVVYPRPVALPKSGLMGVMLKPDDEGMRIVGLVEDGAAAKAGLKKEDLLLRLDGTEVDSMPDVRIALLDKKPGDSVTLQVQRHQNSTGPLLFEKTVSLGD